MGRPGIWELQSWLPTADAGWGSQQILGSALLSTLLFAMKCLFVCMGFVYFNMADAVVPRHSLPLPLPLPMPMPMPISNHPCGLAPSSGFALSGDLQASAIFAEFNQNTNRRVPQLDATCLNSTRLLKAEFQAVPSIFCQQFCPFLCQRKLFAFF